MNRSNTHETIITCLQLNVTNAKTKAMLDFAKEQLHNYLNQPQNRPPCKPNKRQPNWDRIIP